MTGVQTCALPISAGAIAMPAAAKMLSENQLSKSDLISIIFTATADLKSEFPAVAAREIGLGEIPLLCAVEIDVPGALSKVVRVLMHAHSDKDHKQINHIYLRGAQVLRKDIAQ